jgi:type I restriction enzyme S subunit
MTVDTNDLRYILPETHEIIKKYVILKSDLYISIAGSIGKIGIIPDSLDGSNLTENAAKITNLKNVDARFLCYFLNSNFAQNQIKDLIISTNQPKLALFRIEKIITPIAPLPEQRCIVARIEELFSHLDAGVEALQRAKAQLRRYRQAVLKSAVEGRLTEEWRKVHPEVEPAEKLLERIDSTKRKKKKLAPENCNLPDVPDEWIWVNLGEIGNVSGGLTQNSKRNDFPLKIPYLRVANVYAAELRLEEMKDIGLGDNELERVLLNQGDLLVVEGNGSPDQIGRVALWDGSISPCVHKNHIIKARFNPTCIGKYVLYWLLSTSGRERITTVASSTSGLYTLSISKVASLLVPLPSLLEQEKIVEEIESRLSIAKEQDKIIDLNILKADRLRQSILKRAFEGRLVPQDTKDEPASLLLERIQSSKNNSTQKISGKMNKIGAIIKSTRGVLERS